MHATSLTARKISREHHTLSRKSISKNALKVLYRLHRAGYQAFLVGGSVRDLLLGLHPKDFDVVTDAHPQQIRQLFSNCRLVGRRFRLAHILFGKEIVEVATFRSPYKPTHSETRDQEYGVIQNDNIFGTLEEDAARRDFTINNLYYSIADFSVLDFPPAYSDLCNRIIRVIGNPEQRYREDPVRMLRAIRFSAKLGFPLAPETAAPIAQLSPLLKCIAKARLFEETLKLFHSGHATATFPLLRQYHLLDKLLPQVARLCEENPSALHWVNQLLLNTDQRIAAGLPVSAGFLFAALLWPNVQQYVEQLIYEEHLPTYTALQRAGHYILQLQQEHITIPRRFMIMIRDIWQLQWHLEQRNPRKILTWLDHQRFRAAYDLLVLRSNNEKTLVTLAQWWTDLQRASRKKQLRQIQKLKEERNAQKADALA